MDFALSLTSPVRRNSKMDLPLSVYKSKAYDNSVPIHIPMESESSSMFDATPSSCRFTRWVCSQYNSNCNLVQKSAHLSKGGTAKIMLPKGPTVAISISQQTIVGGFVGSKTHAGRSMFGDTSQIWDAVVCKFVELMSLVKEKPNLVEPKSKLNFSDGCISSTVAKNAQPEKFKESVCGSESVPCSSSTKCAPPYLRVSSLVDATDRIPQNTRCVAPIECKAVIPEPEKGTLNSCENILPSLKGTYSSVVGGALKVESARTGSCTMVISSPKTDLPEGFQTNLQCGQLRSYADVAKIIPNKRMARPNKSGCEAVQNLKSMWNTRMKRNKIIPGKKVASCQGNVECINTSADDIVSNGDTRWKGNWRSKRVKFQKSRPSATPSNMHSSVSSDTSEESSIKDSLTKELKTDTGSECTWTMEERDPIRLGCLKEGLRGRHPSECSLDSEDSFVIFEECPDTALAASSPLPVDYNSSLEESETEDDDSSSSDNSDYELDGVERPLRFDCLATNLCVKEDCNWTACFTQSAPEKSPRIKKKTVHFAEGSDLAVIRPMIAWGYAYRESRRGPWEVHARDRARFSGRIASVAPVLNAILDPVHRSKVMASRLYDL
ncbi:uncharacterized protein PPP1R15 [Hetaerina americana]|uniref:uncharacterized protein PPP1R15 n=1 Tax=Hetaerina americana TaxID=62018 RepID=UPI003A7F51FF